MSSKTEKMKEKIRAALKGQTSGLTSLDIRERGEILNAPACMSALTAMKASGEILAHAGTGPRSTRYTLDPVFAGASDARSSAGGGRRRKGSKKKRAKARKAKPAASVVEQEFIPAITADSSLVCITAGMSPPRMFTPEETLAIATLLGNHFG